MRHDQTPPNNPLGLPDPADRVFSGDVSGVAVIDLCKWQVPVTDGAIRFVHERMSDEFEKWHIEGLPIAAAIHHFTGPARGDAHDHPWPFTSFILAGGYVEEVMTSYVPQTAWGPADAPAWRSTKCHRNPGTSHRVEATHIHKIIALPAGECWTLILPGTKVREPGFWRFDGAVEFRQWDWPEYVIA